MAMTIDAVYVSAFEKNVFEGAVSSLAQSSVMQEGDDGTVQVVGRWPRVRRHWQVTYGPTDFDFIETLFEVNGHDFGFLFVPRRARDYIATAQNLGTGDGANKDFQLRKKLVTRDLSSSVVRSVTWDIKYPLLNATSPTRDSAAVPVIYRDATPAVLTTDYTISASGLVSFITAPASMVVITADFQYATPVRWLSDSMDTTQLKVDVNEVRSVTIAEVF